MLWGCEGVGTGASGVVEGGRPLSPDLGGVRWCVVRERGVCA